MASTIVSLVFFANAAIFNAIMDTLSHHYSSSIFKDRDPRFWDPSISWRESSKIGNWMALDAWHIAKSIMLTSIGISIILFDSSAYFIFLLPIIWGVVFEIFYSIILRDK